MNVLWFVLFAVALTAIGIIIGIAASGGHLQRELAQARLEEAMGRAEDQTPDDPPASPAQGDVNP
jgi:hypothetical protein